MRTAFVISFIVVFAFGCDDENSQCGKYPVVLDSATGQYVVEHPETGEKWLRCPVGQSWNESSCECGGEPSVLTENDTDVQCPEGFEWTDNEDFVSILCNYVSYDTPLPDCGQYWQYDPCGECSICDGMFKGDTGMYVSSTDHFDDIPDSGPILGFWMFSFKSGCVFADGLMGHPSVRCVMSD